MINSVSSLNAIEHMSSKCFYDLKLRFGTCSNLGLHLKTLKHVLMLKSFAAKEFCC